MKKIIRKIVKDLGFKREDFTKENLKADLINIIGMISMSGVIVLMLIIIL